MIALPAYQPSVPVLCATAQEWAQDPLSHTYGYTVFAGPPLRPTRIVLSPPVCLGLLLLALDPAGSKDELNPGLDVPALEGEAAVVLEHEIGHTLLGVDETAAQCYGLAHAGDVMGQVPPARKALLMAGVAATDQTLPFQYHARPC